MCIETIDVGTGTIVTGGITAGNALSKMNVPASGVQYSFAKNYEEQAKKAGSYSSKEPKVDNMNQFFDDTEFGQDIADKVSKSSKVYDGQKVYKVDKKIPEYDLKEGDQLYLDGMHKDHIEVFRKNNKVKDVRNLDGTHNASKYNKAKDAGRKLPK